MEAPQPDLPADVTREVMQMTALGFHLIAPVYRAESHFDEDGLRDAMFVAPWGNHEDCRLEFEVFYGDPDRPQSTIVPMRPEVLRLHWERGRPAEGDSPIWHLRGTLPEGPLNPDGLPVTMHAMFEHFVELGVDGGYTGAFPKPVLLDINAWVQIVTPGQESYLHDADGTGMNFATTPPAPITSRSE